MNMTKPTQRKPTESKPVQTKPVQTKPVQTKPIYYWLDGYWITNGDAADVLSEINAFGGTHGVAHFPITATDDEIDKGVIELLKQ